MVVEILTNGRQVYNSGDANPCVNLRVADARNLKKLWAMYRASCEDDLLFCGNGLAGGIVGRGKLKRLLSVKSVS